MDELKESCVKIKELRGRDLRELSDDEIQTHLIAVINANEHVKEIYHYINEIGLKLCDEAERRNKEKSASSEILSVH